MQSLKQWIKRHFPGILYRRQKSAASREAIQAWVEQFDKLPVPELSAVSYNVFTYHGEDGIILYLLGRLKRVPRYFVDIGAGDCIKSNCANLAVHFGWEGLFIDKSASGLALGKNFYKHKINHGVNLKMRSQEVTPGNINQLLTRESVPKDIGLLSVDIDGNDYWIWKAIGVIQPRIIIIEAKVEFGSRNAIVPYGEHNHHSVDKMYNGASVEAFRRLGKEKGYKLVGANKYGYNLFFVREEETVPEAATPGILDHPETKDSFYPESFFASHTFV